MPTSRRDFLRMTGAALAASAFGSAMVQTVAAAQGAEQHPATADPMLHLLNRISYSPRPEEVERIREIGIEAYLDEQLAPDSIDDSAMDDLLRQIPILAMTRQQSHSLGFDGRTHGALMRGFLARGTNSKRQLFERLVEFWTDHFNIPMEDRSHDLIVMHRDVFRRHALGKFRDLAIAVAQSPAMLYYLDNAYSEKEHPNENYARELMELHTLGVDGGYTEADVKAAARALTGWTVFDGTDTGFYFDMEMHDTEAKTILGHEMPANRGIEDGLHLLSILVNHPATARFVSRKLIVRFVSDNPPDSLIDSTIQVWQETDGEIAPVLRHILLSDEFNQSAGLKLRRPLDFFIGAFRATGTTYRNDWQLWDTLREIGQSPYGWEPPNGYPDAAGAWLNSSGLLARWNVAMQLSHEAYSEKDSGLDTHIRERIGDPTIAGELVDAVSAQVFGVPIRSGEYGTFVNYVTDGGDENTPVTALMLAEKLGTLYGLMLASPAYQWR